MDDFDDDELWDAYTKDVKPIQRDKVIRDTKSVQKPSKPEEKKPTPILQEPRQSVRNAKPQAREIDARTAERLRKGQIPIERTLDLHGMRQVEAQAALRDFILKSHNQGRRCVLVITGKGVGEDGCRDPLSSGQGVLKQKVPEWLNASEFVPFILKVQQAQPKHGGSGAVYVLLRRQRA